MSEAEPSQKSEPSEKPPRFGGRRPGLLVEASAGPHGPVLVLRQRSWVLFRFGLFMLLAHGGLCACVVFLAWLPTRDLSGLQLVGLGLFACVYLSAVVVTVRARRRRRLEWLPEEAVLRLDGKEMPAAGLAGVGLVSGRGLFAAPYRLVLLRRAEDPLLLAVDVSFRAAEQAATTIRTWLGHAETQDRARPAPRFEHLELQAASDLVTVTAHPEGIDIVYRRRAQLFIPHLVALAWMAGFGFQDMRDGDIPWTAGLLFASTLWSLWALMQSRQARIDAQGVLHTEVRPILGSVKRESFEAPTLRLEINSQGRLCLMAEDKLKRKFLLFDAADPLGIERFSAVLRRMPGLQLSKVGLPQRPRWDGGALVLADGMLRVVHERAGLRSHSRAAVLYQRPVVPLFALGLAPFATALLDIAGKPRAALLGQLLLAFVAVLLLVHGLRGILAWRRPVELRLEEDLLRVQRGSGSRTLRLDSVSRAELRRLWPWPLSELLPAWQLVLEVAGRPEQLAIAERAETLEPARAWLETLLRADEDWDASAEELEKPAPLEEPG